MATIPEAGAIVVRFDGSEPRVLLVTAKRNRRQWLFPKGHIEPGESAEQAALREAREEAGVEGRVIGPAGRLAFRHGADEIDVTYFLVALEREGPAEEDRDRAWYAFDEALRHLTFDDTRTLLREARLRLPGASR